MIINKFLEKRISIEPYKKNHLVQIDLSEMNDIEILEALLNIDIILKETCQTGILVLLDIKNIKASYGMHVTINRISKDLQPLIVKSAILGVNDSIMPFYKVYKSFMGTKAKLFEKKQDAINYLLEV